MPPTKATATTRTVTSTHATEVCDEIDNDCDGDVDSGASDASTFYADTDADGFGDVSSTTTSCSAPEGYVDDATDCDDGDESVNPDATETCNGTDDDCDGSVDEDAFDATTYYDGDGDGYGTDGSTADACSLPDGAAEAGDCDDDEFTVNPAPRSSTTPSMMTAMVRSMRRRTSRCTG